MYVLCIMYIMQTDTCVEYTGTYLALVICLATSRLCLTYALRVVMLGGRNTNKQWRYQGTEITCIEYICVRQSIIKAREQQALNGKRNGYLSISKMGIKNTVMCSQLITKFTSQSMRSYPHHSTLHRPLARAGCCRPVSTAFSPPAPVNILRLQ